MIRPRSPAGDDGRNIDVANIGAGTPLRTTAYRQRGALGSAPQRVVRDSFVMRARAQQVTLEQCTRACQVARKPAFRASQSAIGPV